MASFGVKALDETTWPDFAQLVERHNGVWGGCWCMSFHPEGVGSRQECGAEPGREGASGPRRPGTRRPRVRRHHMRGLVPVRLAGRAATHQKTAGLSRGSHSASGLADHVLLCRQGLPRPGGRIRSAEGCIGGDRPSRRRHGGKLSRRGGGPIGIGVLPLQRDGLAVRAARL
jgi:hypothetical protein